MSRQAVYCLGRQDDFDNTASGEQAAAPVLPVHRNLLSRGCIDPADAEIVFLRLQDPGPH